MPKGIVPFATAEGWRHRVLTVDGGMHCGRLTDLPVNADPAEARAAAADMVIGLAHDFYDTWVGVSFGAGRFG
ncbi:hypothetical protein [Streptomyces sp. SAS_276]|uniref:hypothetical protein n=1 Tax=Streptomyces sp. SAS_276 TaxID=3412745 RepID=UPI00403CCB76